jgi:3-hydroxyacyl-CoA dehydrogenase
MGDSVRLEIVGRVGVVTIDNPPVNAMSLEVRQGLAAVFRQALAAEIEGLLILGAGRNFMAGADLTELAKGVLPPPPDPNELHDILESASVPVVVAVQGLCLGGGTELALACHYRLAEAGARLGLPEVTLGLLPGAGGTQRLPRLLAAAEALDFMQKGAPVKAGWALDKGLVDEVFTGDARAAGLAFLAGRPALRRTRDRAVVLPEGGLPALGRESTAQKRIRACVEASASLSFADGLALERQLFVECLESREAASALHLFFAERECGKIPGVSPDVKPRDIARIGVVGAGTMGAGIAMSALNAGLPVTLVETSEAALTRGLHTIAKTYEGQVSRGRLSADEAAKRQGLVTGTLIIDDLAACDLVIEAVFESLEVKRAVMATLGRVCRADAVIATNTSTLDVDDLAQASGRPAFVLGLHFFAPAQVMRLLEIVRGRETAPDVLATGLALARRLSKIAVVSGVCYGFIGNRMLEGYLREAEALVLEGAAPARVDGVLEAFGMAMGPLRVMDMSGIDLGLRLVGEAQAGGKVPADPDYRAMTKALAGAGRFGQKSGAGYYRHEGRSAQPDPVVAEIAAGEAARLGITRRTDISDDEILARCLLPLVNEGAKILAEGIAYRAGDIDIVWTNGYGFPRGSGGPMAWAQHKGLGWVVEKLRAHGAGTTPAMDWDIAPLLTELAATGRGFTN